ncbi:MAG: BrnT family toxin [Pseudomonadales bacterium]|nr:BrnT family toxin [Pseudomonadales bacterium]MBO6597318.1 BrnT family toxin [Pseudomonadales bacterium]MBO6824052.1 BrnT family toxin [Pseudomonadales bacterium]
MAYRFEWDERKNKLNQKNHGIDFEDAQTVFFDEEALLIEDPDHSKDEDRFLMLGISSTLRLMVVCHCYREKGDVIRIISARKAIKRERTQYTAKLR